MALVEKLHDSKLHVDYSFDIRERITFYEALCRGYEKKLFEDYPEVKSHMMTLLDRLDPPEPAEGPVPYRQRVRQLPVPAGRGSPPDRLGVLRHV